MRFIIKDVTNVLLGKNGDVLLDIEYPMNDVASEADEIAAKPFENRVVESIQLVLKPDITLNTMNKITSQFESDETTQIDHVEIVFK